eukprot:1162050-Pelagomonas_calceolata.AAC.2
MLLSYEPHTARGEANEGQDTHIAISWELRHACSAPVHECLDHLSILQGHVHGSAHGSCFRRCKPNPRPCAPCCEQVSINGIGHFCSCCSGWLGVSLPGVMQGHVAGWCSSWYELHTMRMSILMHEWDRRACKDESRCQWGRTGTPKHFQLNVPEGSNGAGQEHPSTNARSN